jgi:immune inhibitor A
VSKIKIFCNKNKGNNYKLLSHFFTFLLFYFLTFSLLTAAPHISGKFIKGQPKDKVKLLPDVSHLRRKGAPAIEIAKAIGSVGEKKVAVIVVDFPDKQFTELAQANTTFQKLKDYYNEVSYGKLQLDITFFYNGGSTKTLTGNEKAYTMSKPTTDYAYLPWLDDKEIERRLIELVKTAISTSGVSSSDYHCVMVLHAGYGAESMQDPSGYIWSVYVNWTDSSPVNGFADGTIVPEAEYNTSPVGVTCHEFGHQLGLPDLYYNDYKTGEQYSRVGIWCLMDYGCWAGYPQGSQPAHLSAWCKKFLGWLDVDIVSTTTINYSLPCVETSSQVVKLKILTADNPDNEYFLLEYRKKTSFDSSLPGEGLLIWHVDDSIASDSKRLQQNDINSDSSHLGVDLIEADNKTQIDNNHGDAGDPFPGSSNATSFIPSEYNIQAYNGSPILTSVLNISTSENFANFDVLYGELKIKNLAKGDVKIGNNYTYSGSLMLIGFNLAEASDVEVLVYNLYGRLVKSFGKNYYQAGENNIQWIVKDENNEDLAPGLYFVVVKGNNIHKVEKFIIKK